MDLRPRTRSRHQKAREVRRLAVTPLPNRSIRRTTRRSSIERMAASNLDELQKRLGYSFRDSGLLRLALTHPSVAHESPGATPHNQRLEFLGDSVLGLILTHELYSKFPGFGEGPLTKARAQMVNRHTLAEQARCVSLGEHLILSHGEETSGGGERRSPLAGGFQALSGSI